MSTRSTRPRSRQRLPFVLAGLLALGAGLFFLISGPGGSSPSAERPAEPVSFAGIAPGMERGMAAAALVAAGWQPGLAVSPELVRQGVLAGERFYARPGDGTVEVVGLTFLLHPSGEYVHAVHRLSVAVNRPQRSVGSPPAGLSRFDDAVGDLHGRLSDRHGAAAVQERDQKVTALCCQRVELDFPGGPRVRVDRGVELRAAAMIGDLPALLHKLDRAAGLGQRWSGTPRVAVEGRGERALRELDRAGAVMPAARGHARIWLEAHLAWAGPAIREVAGQPERLAEIRGFGARAAGPSDWRAYLVQAPLARLPGGYADWSPRQFLFPSDVPLPSGAWQDNEVYILDGGVCRTRAGWCPAQRRIFEAWRALRQERALAPERRIEVELTGPRGTAMR